jgi:hybrid cluster-associated redox disulfide protein
MFNTLNNLRRLFFMAAAITKDTIIGDILKINPSSARILLEIGMHCLGCPASRGETLEQACQVHGVDTDEILERINADKEASVYED